MSTLVLVRHGQASFGSGHYDALSSTGIAQCEALREHWHAHGVTFDACLAGSLERQRHSAVLATGTEPSIDEAWNEYDADAIVEHGAPLLAAQSAAFGELQAAHRANPADPRAFQRMFEVLTRAWCRGELTHPSIEPFPAFQHRVRGALSRCLDAPGSRRIAVFTSGGPIGGTVATVLGAPPEKALELNWRIRNASLTEFVFASGGRISLDSFNGVPHLAPGQQTYR